MLTKSARHPIATSRRRFLKSSAAAAGALIIGTYVEFRLDDARAATAQDGPMPNAFVKIAPDNTV